MAIYLQDRLSAIEPEQREQLNLGMGTQLIMQIALSAFGKRLLIDQLSTQLLPPFPQSVIGRGPVYS